MACQGMQPGVPGAGAGRPIPILYPATGKNLFYYRRWKICPEILSDAKKDTAGKMNT